MPNHIHFILWLIDPVGVSLADTQTADTQTGTGASPVPTVTTGWVIPRPEKINAAPALGDVVGAFKSLVFKVYLDWIEIHDPSRRAKFWQRNYYEHIVRNERELNAIRQYVMDNPKNWKMDRDNLENKGNLPTPEKIEDYLQDIEEMLEIKLIGE
jgi:REP element-mobilizing transposase RayT